MGVARPTVGKRAAAACIVAAVCCAAVVVLTSEQGGLTEAVLSAPDSSEWADFEASTRPDELAADSGVPSAPAELLEEAPPLEESPEDFVEPPKLHLQIGSPSEQAPEESELQEQAALQAGLHVEEVEAQDAASRGPSPKEIQAELKAWLDGEESSDDAELLEEKQTGAVPAGGMIKAIVSLKAYSMAAKDKLSSAAMADFKGDLRSGLIDFIMGFGEDSGKELITEYARVIGDLKAAHPENPGIGGYLVDAINANILEGNSIVKIIENEGQEHLKNYHILDHEKLGLMEMPGYLMKLAVSNDVFQANQMKLHVGNGGDAIKMYEKSSKTSIYNSFLAKLSARYQSQQISEMNYAEVGGKYAIERALEDGFKANVTARLLPGPLPSAGQKGAEKIRGMRAFKMPTLEQMAQEAMEEAKKYLAVVAKQNLDARAVAEAIMAELEGVTIRITTSHRHFAESHQSPSVRIVGTKGEVKGTIDALPLNGEKLTQRFDSKNGPIGVAQFAVLESDAKAANPWLCTKFEVQVGHGNAWVTMAPNGKTSLTDGWWLDGTNSTKGPFFGLMRQDKVMLMPTEQQLAYTKLTTGHAPFCPSLPDQEVPREVGGAACFAGDKDQLQEACGKVTRCQGFTYTTGKSKGGKGCLKYRCHSKDTDNDVGAHAEQGVDYYTRQSIQYAAESPTAHCPTECGLNATTFYGRVVCKTITTGDEVSLEQCAFHQPALVKPERPSLSCGATPVCVEYKKSKPKLNKLAPTCTGKVSLFQHGDFSGWKADYKKGSYPFAQFIAAGAKNDDMSSIKVPVGCQATVYQHGDRSGWAATYPAGSYNFNAFLAKGAKNDDASAVDVIDAPLSLRHKPTAMSSTGYGGESSRAVDGNTDGTYGHNSCTHTGKSGDEWWRVDLEYEYEITNVQIFNRVDCCSDRLNGVTVAVSEDDNKAHRKVCAVQGQPPPPAPPPSPAPPPAFQCSGWPTKVGTPQAKCENGNSLKNGFEYKYNAGRSGSKPGACGIGGCWCCKRKVTTPVGSVFLEESAKRIGLPTKRAPAAGVSALAMVQDTQFSMAPTVNNMACNRRGRYLWISQPSKHHLTLCEVKVEAKPALGACSSSCGMAAQTFPGRVWCEETASGKVVPDGKCAYWNMTKPEEPFLYCEATPSC